MPVQECLKSTSVAICQPQLCRQPDLETARSEGQKALEGTVAWAIEGLHLCCYHHGERVPVRAVSPSVVFSSVPLS